MTVVLVTGATGLTGSNVCRQLIERGDVARALVRSPSDAAPLAKLGVEPVQGDVTDAESVLAASRGAEAVIHTAALLGGSSQDPGDFEAVNLVGTRNVLDVAESVGMRRVVAFSTGSFLDMAATADLEDAPLLDDPPTDPYTQTKLAAFLDVHRRAEAGFDALTCHPGAIFGEGPVTERALARTTFNRVILAALRGRMTQSLGYPVSWVTGDDVARGALAALDNGKPGDRYWFVGHPDDRMSTAQLCNQAIAIAGLPHHVDDVDPRSDQETLVSLYGPTLVAVAVKIVETAQPRRPVVSKTSKTIGYRPTRLHDGLERLVTWLRDLGRI
jgi:dihydroflavonol-4-reductase